MSSIKLTHKKKKELIKTLSSHKDDDNKYTVQNYIIEIVIDLLVNAKKMYMNDLIEIFKGAHVQIKYDDEYFYNKWKNMYKAHPTYLSSHKSTKKQIRICSKGTLSKYSKNKKGFQLLIGTYSQNNKNHTWFQFEKTPMFDETSFFKTFINTIKHIINFVEYQITNKNVGPYGSSKYTESNPFIFEIYKNYKDKNKKKKYVKILRKIDS